MCGNNLKQIPISKTTDAVYEDSDYGKILRKMEITFDLTQWKDKIYQIQDVGRILYHDDVCIYFNNKEVGLEHKYETCRYNGRLVSVKFEESFDDALNELGKLVRNDLEFLVKEELDYHIKNEMKLYEIDPYDKEEYESFKKQYDWAFEALAWVK